MYVCMMYSFVKVYRRLNFLLFTNNYNTNRCIIDDTLTGTDLYPLIGGSGPDTLLGGKLDAISVIRG